MGGARRRALLAPPGRPGAPAPSSCNAIRLWHAPFAHPRYATPAPWGTRPTPIEIPCQVKGPHGMHRGAGGVRWS